MEIDRGTGGDDIIVPTSPGNTYLGLDGADVFFVDPSAIGPGPVPIIIEAGAGDSIRFLDGVTIESFRVNVAQSGQIAIELTLPTGQVIRVLGDTGGIGFDLGATGLTTGFITSLIGEFIESVLGIPVPGLGGQGNGGPVTLGPPQLSLSVAPTVEGDPGDTPLTQVTVSLDRPAPQDVPFTIEAFGLAPGDTATPFADFDPLALPGLVAQVVPQGATEVILDLPFVVPDEAAELDEAVTLSLLDGRLPPFSPPVDTAVAEILDDDPPVVSVGQEAAVVEGDTPGDDRRLVFTVSLDRPSPRDVSVDFLTPVGGTASEIDDYVASAIDTLTIPAGATTATVEVAIREDTRIEADETVRFEIRDPVNAVLGTATGTGLIIDDDGTFTPPFVSILPESLQVEGDPGDDRRLVFTVALDRPSARDASFDFATTAAGSATPGVDFEAVSQRLTIPAGQTRVTVEVPIIEDDTGEFDETVEVEISNPQDATLIGASRAGTIVNDDGPIPPKVSLLDLNPGGLPEGDAGQELQYEFLVSLDRSTSQPVTVKLSTVPPGTAEEGTDFIGADQRMVTVPAGFTSTRAAITVVGDDATEADETFTVEIADPVNAVLGATTAQTGTILNDDLPPGPPKVSILPPDTIQEGNAGLTPFNFRLQLDRVAAQDVTVSLARSGTADGTDLFGTFPSSVTIGAGGDFAEVPVAVAGDETPEIDDTVTVTITGATNADPDPGASAATGTILNDDQPFVSIADATDAAEGGGPLSFPVTLSEPHEKVVTVAVTVRDAASPQDAVRDSDFTLPALFSGIVTFPPGETARSLDLPVIDDALVEGGPGSFESVFVDISAPLEAIIALPDDANATGLIEDNDAPTVTEAPIAEFVQLNLANPLDPNLDIIFSDYGFLRLTPPPGGLPPFVTVWIDGTKVVQNQLLPEMLPPNLASHVTLPVALPVTPGTQIGSPPATAVFHDFPLATGPAPFPPGPVTATGQNFLTGGELDALDQPIDQSQHFDASFFDADGDVTLPDLLGELPVRHAHLPNADQFTLPDIPFDGAVAAQVSAALDLVPLPPGFDSSVGAIETLLGQTAGGVPRSWPDVLVAHPDIPARHLDFTDGDGLGPSDLDTMLDALGAGVPVILDLRGNAVNLIGLREKANGEIDLDYVDDNQFPFPAGADPLWTGTLGEDPSGHTLNGIPIEGALVFSEPPPSLLAERAGPLPFDPGEETSLFGGGGMFDLLA